jgi:hypothetical protein
MGSKIGEASESVSLGKPGSSMSFAGGRRIGFHGPRSRRGLSSIAGVIVIVLVLVLMGVTTYALTGGFTKIPPPSCAPATSPVCTASTNLHDVSVLLPYRSVQQGANVPVTASLPSGEVVSKFYFHFGDGSNVSTPNATSTHVYAVPGIYLIVVQAKIGPVLHDRSSSPRRSPPTPRVSSRRSRAPSSPTRRPPRPRRARPRSSSRRRR